MSPDGDTDPEDPALEVRYRGPEFDRGTGFEIVHCRAARASYEEALKGVGRKKRVSMTGGIIAQIERLASGARMPSQQFPREGDLLAEPGKEASPFWAFKRKPLRGYCWFSETRKRTWFISHYVYKRWEKLRKGDTTRVHANWQRIERSGDER